MKRVAVKRVVAISLLLATVVSVGAQDIIGEITYLEGFPEIVRDGDVLFDTVDFGFPVENFDSIRTDSDSYIDIEIDPQTGIDATISVQPDTLFSIDISSLRSEQTGTIELIAGSVNVVARRLAGQSRFQIRTPSATMGIRGTTFSVTTAVGGEILVATEEGLVEVNQFGTTLFAAPGEAVEVNPESGIFRNIKFRQDRLDDFRSQWVRERVDAFVANAPRVLAFYGRRYVQVREAFIRSYGALMGHREIIDKWIDEQRRGDIGSRIETLREKRQIIGALLRIRMSLFFFENLFTRLERMAPYVREFAAEIEISEGFTAADMYRTINADRRIMARRINGVRRIMKLFALRNEGEMPFQDVEGFQGVFGPEGLLGGGEDDFFGDEDDFFESDFLDDEDDFLGE